ncbi:MAG: hypothetical protein KKF12_14455 [Proteobacteria bacterium]|nr:hypothetical protein [Desulfobacula sp.]MBU3950760.1 hypothetical protein [Pseudomonadota bacterium]MBU4132016.1 hypothetical protein [Pseudomonadota bacterium]
MKFSDFFVPKYVHSNPQVRIKFIGKTTDVTLLESIVEKDQDGEVVQAARQRIQALTVSHTE